MDWFPHNIEAYDTDTLHLTAAEDGVYHRLLRWYYEHERALPDNDVSLAAIARITPAEWGPMANRIRAFFETRVSRVTNVATLHQKRANAYILEKNTKRRDGKARQEKFRKNSMLGDNYDVSRVTNAADRNRIGVVESPSLFERESQTTQTEPLETVGVGSKKDDLAAVLAEFEIWWANVPRKKAKPIAQKAYLAARKKVGAQTLLEGIERYGRERQGQDAHYTAHPATWLNEERWTDEPGSNAGPAPERNHRPVHSIAAARDIVLAEDRERSADRSEVRDGYRVDPRDPDIAVPIRRTRPSALED